MPNGWQYWLYGPGESANNVTRMPNVTAIQTALIAAEYARYVAEWAVEFAPLYTSPRYTVSTVWCLIRIRRTDFRFSMEYRIA